jgi:hypothetical protein
MITVRLAGGLGNQLFQLAAALYLKEDTPIRLLTNELLNYSKPRQPEILKLIDCNKLQLISINEPSLIDKFFSKARAGRFMPLIGVNDRNFKDLREGSCQYAWLDGYFQDTWSTKNIQIIAQQIQGALTTGNFEFESVADLAVHVRGGDFLNHPDLDIVSIDWYLSNIQIFSKSRVIKTAAVLTDDHVYAKKLIEIFKHSFPEINFKMIGTGSLIDDFNILRCARFKVIGNSTFALWACLLSPLTGRIMAPKWLAVRRPRYWLLPGEDEPLIF